jgi:hypothetical protein
VIPIPQIEWRLVEVFGLALLVLAAFRLLRRGARQLAQRPGLAGRLHRLLPLVEGLALLLLLAAALRILLGDRPELLAGAALLLLAGLLWAARGWLQDLVSGWALRLEEPWTPGRRVRLEAGEGSVDRLGQRSLTLLADDGRRIWLPWSRLAGQAVEVLGGGQGRAGTTCRLKVPLDAGDGEGQRRGLERRLLLDPRVLPTSPIWISSEENRVEVRVQLLDAGVAADLERDLRGAQPSGTGERS